MIRAITGTGSAAPASLAPTRPGFSAPTRAPVLPPTSAEDAERKASAGLDAFTFEPGRVGRYLSLALDPCGAARASRKPR